VHLQEQLLQTGKQNLAMKNIQAQAVAAASGLQPVFQVAAPSAASMYPLVSHVALKHHFLGLSDGGGRVLSVIMSSRDDVDIAAPETCWWTCMRSFSKFVFITIQSKSEMEGR